MTPLSPLTSLQASPVPDLPSFRPTPGEIRVFRSRGGASVSEWADQHRIVTEGSRLGSWRTSATPYTRGPMDAFSDPSVRSIILCWAPQTGKSQIALNCIGYAADTNPGPVLFVLPNEKKAKAYNARKIVPLIRTSPRLRPLFSDRKADVNRYQVTLANGMEIITVWATSAAELSEMSIRYIVMDETDKYEEFTGKEADPVSLAEERTNAFPYTKKHLYISTPTTDDGIIWRLMNNEADEIRDYHVPCPFCTTLQVMRFDSLTWPASITDYREIRRRHIVHYVCTSCGMKWDERTRDEAVRLGQWIARTPVVRPTSIAFHLPSWYSPFVPLWKPVVQRLKASEDPTKMMAFVTQACAEAFTETIEAAHESKVLSHKTTLPSGLVPASALALTCGIDSHKWGYRFVIRAWDDDMTSYKIQHGTAGTLDDVEQIIFNVTYPIADETGAPTDKTMRIWRSAMDTGGYTDDTDRNLTMTEEIYQFLRDMRRKYLDRGEVLFGVKGSSHRQMIRVKTTTIDKFPHTGKAIPGGLKIKLLDTASYKLLIHQRLSRTDEETQRFYVDADTGMDYVNELLAEELIKTRKGRHIWRKIRPNNHALDAEVYAASCADGEWIPSFKMLIPRFRELLARPAGENVQPLPNINVRRVVSRGLDL